MIYFDNGSTSFPKAPGVGAAMAALLENAGFNINRGGYEGAYAVADMVLDTREMLCKLFDWQDPKDVCFTGNVTQSLNLILKGFLKPGDHVVVSSMEHNAVMRPLNQLAAQGVAFDAAQADPDGTLPIARGRGAASARYPPGGHDPCLQHLRHHPAHPGGGRLMQGKGHPLCGGRCPDRRHPTPFYERPPRRRHRFHRAQGPAGPSRASAVW